MPLSPRKNRALVTGDAGLIGSHVIRQQGSVKDYFAAAELILRKKGILQKVKA